MLNLTHNTVKCLSDERDVAKNDESEDQMKRKKNQINVLVTQYLKVAAGKI